MFTKISIYHHHQQQHLSVPALNSNCTLRVFETNGVSLSDVVAAPKKILKYERCWLYMYAIEGSQKNLSCHSNCVVWTGAPLRLQCVTLASNRTILPIYTSQKMVHYLEVTTTALLAMLCPLLVTSQEVFQAEVIIFFYFVIFTRMWIVHRMVVNHALFLYNFVVYWWKQCSVFSMDVSLPWNARSLCWPLILYPS